MKETRLNKETVNSGKLLEDVVSLTISEIDEKNINLVREYRDSADIYIDPTRIREALLNILKNAVQAVSPESMITVRNYVKDDKCVFEIQDTGPGINETDMQYIFDPFFTTKKTGTGLGLAITHRIVEEHKGSIEVESKQGAGSTFRVLLPLT